MIYSIMVLAVLKNLSQYYITKFEILLAVKDNIFKNI